MEKRTYPKISEELIEEFVNAFLALKAQLRLIRDHAEHCEDTQGTQRESSDLSRSLGTAQPERTSPDQRLEARSRELMLRDALQMPELDWLWRDSLP